MKYFIFITLIALLAACGAAPSNPTTQPQPGEVVLSTVTFQGTTKYQVTGTAKTLQLGAALSLRLENDFSVSQGPDLHVWLIKDEADTPSHLELGKLTAFSGSQTFAIPAGTKLSDYKFVYIWCQSVSELFGKASLDGSTTPPTTPPTPTEIANGKLSGDSEGDVKVIQTGTARTLELAANFKANGTNNVNIWLATDDKGAGYIDLGDLKTTGAQTFNIPDSTDLVVYKYLVIWCSDINMVIGIANLGGSTTPPPTPTPPAPTPPTPTVILRGTLGKDSRGDVQVVQTGTARTLELAANFKANGTNNVDIWLATDTTGTGYIDLGTLKTTGAQNFTIPASVDLASYKYLIIWCADVSSVIGTAELK
jgi:Electron transfer DM13